MARHKVSVGKASAAPGAGQLAAGHYVEAKLAPVIVSPRPDSETNAWERCRMAPDGIAWSVPLSLKGGAFPESWELLSGPSGMVAEQVLWSWGTQRYWRLRWPTPVVGSHAVSLRVRTQEYGRNTSGLDDELTMDFTLAVYDKNDTARFIFLDIASGRNYGTGAVGSYADPFKHLNDWYRSDEGLATAKNKQIFYRSGTYPFTNGPETTPGVFDITLNQGNLNFTGVDGPLVHIGYPGESVIFDCANPADATSGLNYGGKWFLTGSTGLFMQNITMQNGRQDLNNAHFFWLTGRAKEKRVTLFENSFDHMGPGLVGNDNTSVMFGSAVNYANRCMYYSFVGNTYNDLGGSANGVSMYDLYRTELIVTEGNIFGNCPSRYGAWHKALNGNFSVRNNYMWTNNSPASSPCAVIEVNTDLAAGEVPMPINPGEVCWNIVKSDVVDDARRYTIGCDITSEGTTEINAYHVYRNTVGGSIGNEGPVDASSTVTNNLILRRTGYSTSIKNFAAAAVTDNVVLSTGDLDASGFLTGAARASYLGTVGAEVA